MSVVVASLGISLDGFVAGPDNADPRRLLPWGAGCSTRVRSGGRTRRAPVFVLTHDSREPYSMSRNYISLLSCSERERGCSTVAS
jgi:hypothetical protein